MEHVIIMFCALNLFIIITGWRVDEFNCHFVEATDKKERKKKETLVCPLGAKISINQFK